MLFERIRRTQKPVFIFLAVMFGLGFVALGVGQGANSIDLGSLFSSGSSSGTSISDLQSRTQDHPKDATAWLQLARAYQGDNQTTQAITAYQTYLNLKPEDQTALAAAAALLEQRGATNAQKVLRYRALAQAYTQVNGATAAGSLKLSAALSHPLLQTLAQPFQTKVSTFETSAITDYAQAMGMRQKITKLTPQDAAAQLALARDAYATQSYGTVATALQAYMTLSPNLTKAQKAQLRQQVAQFRLLAKQSATAGSTTSPGG